MNTTLSEPLAYEDPRESSFQAMVEERLNASRFTAAARVVLEAVRIGWAPNDISLVHWIAARVGTHATQLVIGKGFAQLGGPCCHSGFEACDNCDGNGSYGHTACAQCATTGKVRCPFCSGSSLIPLADLPLALRPRTTVARVRLADAHATHLLKAGIPEVSSDASMPNELRTSFLNLDKLLGVLENALIEMRQLAPTQALQEFSDQVLSLAQKLRDRQLLILRRLRECELAIAGTRDPRAMLAMSHADVLKEICQAGNLSASLLAHPFLFPQDIKQ